MGSAATIGMLMGGLNAAGTLLGGVQQSRQMQANAEQARAQARNYETQAKEAEERGRIEAKQIDEQKSRLRKTYADTAARNRTLLGAGNVDMQSGSALDMQEGNIENFSADIADNAYAKAMKEWETKTNSSRLLAAADNSRAQASAYQSQGSNLFPTLLNTAISGATGFASGYSMAGGSLKSLWSREGEKAAAKAAGGQVK